MRSAKALHPCFLKIMESGELLSCTSMLPVKNDIRRTLCSFGISQHTSPAIAIATCKAQSPQTLLSQEFVKPMDSLLGIRAPPLPGACIVMSGRRAHGPTI